MTSSVADTEPAVQPGTVVLGRYRVLEELGRGGVGVVYRAVDGEVHRTVALKLEREPSPGGPPRWLFEPPLEHVSIVAHGDAGRLEDGRSYLVMELLQGQTLGERVRREGPLREPALLELADVLLAGLEAAHARGLVHGDLKPDNVFLSTDGPKLLDFSAPEAHVPGEVHGTPHYLAPEQARGDAELDARVDVWALGVTLYEAATGVLPFNADSYPALLERIASRRPVSPRRFAPITEGFERLILDALEPELGARLPDARTMRARVAALESA